MTIFAICRAVILQPIKGQLPPLPQDDDDIHHRLSQTIVAALGMFGFGFLASDVRAAPLFLMWTACPVPQSYPTHSSQSLASLQPTPTAHGNSLLRGAVCGQLKLGATVLPNVGMCALSFIAFYRMLFCLDSILYRAQHTPLLQFSGVWRQFRLVRLAVIFVWHIFPTVWIGAPRPEFSTACHWRHPNRAARHIAVRSRC